jgi:hypothetical protein
MQQFVLHELSIDGPHQTPKSDKLSAEIHIDMDKRQMGSAKGDTDQTVALLR